MIWYDWIWYDWIWYDMIWYDMIPNEMMCYGAIWYVIANNVYTMWLINKNKVSNLQMSCLCACFDGIVSIVQSVHVTSWNYSFPSHSTTHLIGKHMCKYSSKNNIKQSNTRCAESMARRKKTSNWHRIVVLSWTTLIRLSCCSALLHSFSQTLCGVSCLVEL